MSELRAQVQKHYDAVNRGDMDTAMTVFDPDVEGVTPNGTMNGREALRQLGDAFIAAAPNQRLEMVRVVESGDTVVVEGVYSGTQTGALVGPGGTIDASGNDFAFPFCDVFTFRNGLCVSHHIYWDNLSLGAPA
jgi:ketosteroid isomerase-like protein